MSRVWIGLAALTVAAGFGDTALRSEGHDNDTTTRGLEILVEHYGVLGAKGGHEEDGKGRYQYHMGEPEIKKVSAHSGHCGSDRFLGPSDTSLNF